MKKKKQNWKDKLRENPYIASTVILVFLAIFLIFSLQGSIESGKSVEDICKEMKGTPAWVTDEGEISSYGFNNFNGAGEGYIVNLLIQGKIHFYYSPTCGWCKKQIEWFNKSWYDYQVSNFTHDCGEILGVGK